MDCQLMADSTGVWGLLCYRGRRGRYVRVA